MPSPFDAIHMTIHRETSKVWGEGFTHRPMRQRPNKGPIPDPDRAGCCFTGQFAREHRSEEMAQYGARSSRAAISSKSPTLRVALVDLDNVKQDDVIERHDPHTVYMVSDVQADGRGVAILTLLETAAPRQAP
jgi:hypothetical protein